VVTRSYPRYELFALTDQTRRSAISVPANIAEGAGRFGSGEYRHHVSIARGSLAELRTLLELAFRFGHLNQEQIAELHADVDEIDGMLCVLHRKLAK